MFCSKLGNLQRLSKCLPVIHNNHVRLLSDLKIKQLSYNKYGDPSEVVALEEKTVQYDLGRNDVLVRMLASPVNPADINAIQGSYPIKPPLPGVGGGEGVGEVIAAGEEAGLSVGDWVLPGGVMTGTWKTHALGTKDDWIKVRNDIPVMAAATLYINPCTALRMLRDFVSLRPGDWVIQNGSNSGVGQAVVQIAASMGLNTVNVVRDREDIGEMKKWLENLGGTMVLTEEEVRKMMAWRNKELPRPKLALNCVGGASSTELCKALATGGVHVTYGGMSLKPVTAATSHLIFKDLSMRGFWMGNWKKQQGRSELRMSMYTELTDLVAAGKLTAPEHTLLELEDYKEALENPFSGFKQGKYIFDMRIE